jgi:hypothetical protein
MVLLNNFKKFIDMIKKNFNKLMNCFYYIKDFYQKSLNNSPLILSFKSPYNYKKVTAHYSFILPFILSKIDWDGHKNVEFTPAGDIYYVGVFLLSLTALFCFYNAMAYFLSIYLIQRYNIEQKYPKLNRIVKYYEKTGFIFIILDCIICVVALLVLCITAFIYAFVIKIK